MKSKLLLLALTIGMMGCDVPNVEQKTTQHAIAGHASLDEVTIEGCQYLLGNWGNATVLTHKGNCNNPIHQHNGGEDEH
jgi:hypothetical protein